MAFTFSLAAVLRFRGILEEREEAMLHKILFQISQTMDLLADNDAEIARCNAGLNAQIDLLHAGHHIHASYGEVQELKQQRTEIYDQLSKLEQLRERQLLVYTAAKQNRQMLTDMHKDQREAHVSEVTRIEQKNLDDNHIARRARS